MIGTRTRSFTRRSTPAQRSRRCSRTPAHAQDAAGAGRRRSAGRQRSPATSSSPRAAARKRCSTCRSRSPPSPATQLDKHRRARHHRHLDDHAQRHARRTSRGTNSTLTAFIRGVGQQDPVAGLRGGRRHLSRRRLSQPSAGGGARHLRRRADRSAARAAGHALRPQHDRRRDQIRHPAAARRFRRCRLRGTYGTLQPGRRHRQRCRRRSATMFRVGASVARLTRDGFGAQPDHLGIDNYNKDIWAGARHGRVRDARRRLVRPHHRRLHPRQVEPAQRPPPDSPAC